MFFFEEIFAGAGHLAKAKFGHLGAVGAREAFEEEFHGGAGGWGIHADVELPIGELVTGNGDFDFLHGGIVAEVEDDLGGVVEAMVFGGVKFGEHQPTFEVVLLFFELGDDFKFGVLVFAKL